MTKKSGKAPAVVTAGILGVVGLAAAYFIRASGPTSPFVWMINIGAVQQLQTAGYSQANIEYFFNNPQTFYMHTPPKGWSSVPTVTYTSYDNLKTAFDNNQVDPKAGAIIYDNENWQYTPDNEKQDPAKYEMLAGQIIHQHHLIFISTPAVTLVKAQKPNSTNPYDDYLALGFARDAAKYADVYEIQAQGSQPTPAKYINFVTAAASQAKQANPKVTVLAGLSTNPNGQKVSGDQIYQAVQGTRQVVKGYWLNIPGQSDYCPGCGQPQPQVAVELLNKLLAESAPKTPPPPPPPPALTPPPPPVQPPPPPPPPVAWGGDKTDTGTGAKKLVTTNIDHDVNSGDPALKPPQPSQRPLAQRQVDSVKSWWQQIWRWLNL